MQNIFKIGDNVRSLWYGTSGEIGTIIGTDSYCAYVVGFSDGTRDKYCERECMAYDFDYLEKISSQNNEINFYSKYLWKN